MVRDTRARLIRYSLGGLLGFGAINAIGGGIYGLTDPNAISLELLEGSPFSNYFVPSLFLLIVVGGSLSYAAYAVLSGARAARASALAAAVVVLAWIIVQVGIIGVVSLMQPLTFIGGILALFFVWLLPKVVPPEDAV